MTLSKVRITTLKKMKESGEKITMLTAYDFPIAHILDESNIDIVLIGDSLGNVILGYENTLKVTMDDMIRYTGAVSRAVKRSLIVADMPFMSYQIDKKEALRNAGKLLQSGAEAVKLEGGVSIAKTIKKCVETGIPVMGHIGLTPQSINQLGGYRVQGKVDGDVKKLIDDAKAIEDAGCFAIVVECVPEDVGKLITDSIKIPTIGIGAGKYCDGQVLVINDLLGLSPNKPPKLAKQYINGYEIFKKAVGEFRDDVKNSIFPTEDNKY